MLLSVLIGRMRHEGCDGVSSRPVRRIVLRG
jgi:hypothetical protein